MSPLSRDRCRASQPEPTTQGLLRFRGGALRGGQGDIYPWESCGVCVPDPGCRRSRCGPSPSCEASSSRSCTRPSSVEALLNRVSIAWPISASRRYKIPDGKPPNKFALGERCMGRKYALKVSSACAARCYRPDQWGWTPRVRAECCCDAPRRLGPALEMLSRSRVERPLQIAVSAHTYPSDMISVEK